jgi:SH3 domain protein
MRFTKTILLSMLLGTCHYGAALAAETMYVTDIFEVTMRSGTSTANSIVRMLKSGEPVTVIEHDLVSKYSLVQSSDGKQGYVITRFLMDQPSARERLADLGARFEEQSQRVESQQARIAELSQSLEQERADNQALASTLRASEQELTEVRSAAQDTLNIIEQNKRLQTVVDELRQEKTALVEANAELGDTTRRDWFVRGGAVSLIAFLVGIIVTRIRWRKQDSWGSY